MAVKKEDLPHNLDIEKGTLGLMIYSRSCCDEAISRLGEDDFFNKNNKIIFNAIYSLTIQNRKIDPETVVEELKNSKSLEIVGGIDYIEELVDSVISVSMIGEYIDVLRENTNLRQILITIAEIEEEYLYKKIDNKNDFISSIQQRINKVADQRKISNFLSSKEVGTMYGHQIDDLISNRANRELTGINTGYRLLNYHLDGLQKETLVIVAGRTGTGKTTFALNLMLNAAMLDNVPVAIFEMEMSASQLFMRLTSNRANIDSKKLQKGKDITPEERQSIKKTIAELSTLDIFIDESASTTINDIVTKSRKLKKEKPDLGLIVIDHLGIITSDYSKKGKKFDSRQLEIQEYTRILHELARELKVPVVLVCQLNRKATEREGTPKLADLRESGTIEQDSEVVILLHREDYEKNDYDLKLQSQKKVKAANMSAEARSAMMEHIENKAAEAAGLPKEEKDKSTTLMHVIIAKNRNGQSDQDVCLIYKKNFFKFEDANDKFLSKKKEIESTFED